MSIALPLDAAPPTGELPPGWAWVPVESLATRDGGLTDGPFGSNLKTSHYTDSGPRVIRLQNIGEGVFHDEHAHITCDHFEHLLKHEAKAQDVVVAMLGEKLPRACLVPDHIGPAIVKADCARLRVDLRLAMPGLVAAGLNSPFLRRQADEFVHGVGRPRLGLRWLKTLQFPLAPLREQHRIVDAIESQFTRLDAAAASLDRVKAKLKRYKASVLKAAVEGRLVPTEAELARREGRTFEPASVLLDRILRERRMRWEDAELARLTAAGKTPKDDRWKARYEVPVAPNTTGLTDLPKGWCWASLEALTSAVRVICYGILMPLQHVPHGVPYVKVRDMRSGVLSVDRLPRTAPEIEAKYARSRLQAGDLLMAIRGTWGLVVDVPPELEGGNITQDSARLALHPTLHRRYIKHALLSGNAQGFFSRVARGVGVKGVNIRDLRATPIPLPPLAEQTRIAEHVDDLLSIHGEAEVITAKNAVRCARLRQAILKWAFEGKLVDQDPTDEPASALLKRIKAERGKVEGGGTRKLARSRMVKSA